MKKQQISSTDYEKLGAFYLGCEYDFNKRQALDCPLLYNSKDLVTHGVVLGMTGSGKTGLCISLLEEAGMDGIPAIVIDPKGDISNLLLTFPNLSGDDFLPWVNQSDAEKKGILVQEHAQNQADLWKNGLQKWGQSPQRISDFRQKTDINIYTPGSSAGLPVSILSSLNAPSFEIIDDSELFADLIESTVSSLLSLLGIDADPIQSQEHIFLSNIFNHNWSAEKNLNLELLVAQIQAPPFDKIGVMSLESFFPEKKRFELAMRMNNLLAAPGFKTWFEGEPLDIQRMLYRKDGKPRISIFAISHLSDAERMFFVSLLLNQTLSWMRSQSGTNSLRALLYMDEIFGYLPPSQNPPSKKPLMTILKQARAFGLGALLATQNPVDLDYKALSNIGSWFLGRLQTERDKMRVLDGLEGAISEQGKAFKRSDLEKILTNLDKRVFLLNNVHEDAPEVFQVRWVMSYLRGPLTRSQIRKLMAEKREQVLSTSQADSQNLLPSKKFVSSNTQKPSLPKNITQRFLSLDNVDSDAKLYYAPSVFAQGNIKFNQQSKGIHGEIKFLKAFKISTKTSEPNLNKGIDLQGKSQLLSPTPHSADAGYEELPGFALDAKNYDKFGKELVDFLYDNFSLSVFKSESSDLFSQPGESEGDFRTRLVHAGREKRDEILSETKEKFEKLIERLEDKIAKATDKVDVQKAQARQAGISTVVSIGSSILGSLLGGRKRSILSSGRGAGRVWKEKREADVAERELERLEAELADLEEEMRSALAKHERSIDPMTEKLEVLKITPYKKDINVTEVGLLWLTQKES